MSVTNTFNYIPVWTVAFSRPWVMGERGARDVTKVMRPEVGTNKKPTAEEWPRDRTKLG